MKTATMTTKLATLETKGGHVARLLKVLDNPSEWQYTGTCIDAGMGSQEKCACGHPIRFVFLIKHLRHGQKQVGSTCIDHINEVTPELGEILIAARDKMIADLADAKKLAKKVAADAINVKLWEEYTNLRDELIGWHKAERSAGRRSPRPVWYFAEGWHEKYRVYSQPEYVRASSLKKWLEKAIGYATSIKVEAQI